MLFLHANGFPSGSYAQFLQALGQFGQVHAPEIIQTPLSMAPASRWRHMADFACSQVRSLGSKAQPLALVGHSMGGYLSLMAASRHSELVDAVVLIDAPIAMAWRRPLLETLRHLHLTKLVGPAPVAAKRRFEWPSMIAAKEHLSQKSFARHWAPGVMDDFLAAALVESGNGVVLRIPREVEKDIYANLPSQRAFSALRELNRIGKSVTMIAGSRSVETNLAGRSANRRLFGERWLELDAGHLVPMEQPAACASVIGESLAKGG